MENVSAGVLEKIKKNILEVRIKPKNDMMYQDKYIIAYVKIQKNEDILSIMPNLTMLDIKYATNRPFPELMLTQINVLHLLSLALIN